MSARGAFALLQKIGRALMLPVSVLPVAGLLLGLGSAKLGLFPDAVSSVLAQAGGAIFTALPADVGDDHDGGASQFGQGLIDDRELQIDAQQVRIPGFSQPLVYRKDERYADML